MSANYAQRRARGELKEGAKTGTPQRVGQVILRHAKSKQKHEKVVQQRKERGSASDMDEK